MSDKLKRTHEAPQRLRFLAILIFIVIAASTSSCAKLFLIAKPVTVHRVTVIGDLQPDRARYYASLCDSFLNYVDQNYCHLTGKYPMTACLFKDQETYSKFVRIVLGETDPIYFGYGFYSGSSNTFYSWDGSGVGTMTHEIMHKVCFDEKLLRELWAREGIPTFFEKLYGYRQNDNLVLSIGYHNPWRIEALGDDLLKQDIAAIYTRAKGEGEDESAERLISMFLYERGQLKDYLAISKSGNLKGFNTYLEAALGKSFDQIRPEWRAYIKQIYKNRAEIENLPLSQVFATREEFLRFMSENKVPIR